MSRQVFAGPLAVASDGTVLINATEFIGRKSPARLLQAVLEERGQVFIGVTVSPAEARLMLDFLADGTVEAAGRVVGRRQRRRR